MNILSSEIICFLEEFGLKYNEVLHYNNRKKTTVLIVSDNDKKFILKAIDKNSPTEIKQSFYIEVNFYLKYISNFIPIYVQSNDWILLTEFIESKTLRECLSFSKSTHIDYYSLFNNLINFYENCVKNESKIETYSFDRVHSYLGALLLSGPMQTKDVKVSYIDRFFSLVLLKILRFKLKRNLKKINVQSLKGQFSHGDFHYNNILIPTSNEGLKIIDFENFDKHGFFDFDLIYLFVMVELNISGNKNMFYEIEQLIIKQEKELLNTINILRVAVKSNKRFHTKLKINNSKLSLLKSALSL